MRRAYLRAARPRRGARNAEEQRNAGTLRVGTTGIRCSSPATTSWFHQSTTYDRAPHYVSPALPRLPSSPQLSPGSPHSIATHPRLAYNTPPAWTDKRMSLARPTRSLSWESRRRLSRFSCKLQAIDAGVTQRQRMSFSSIQSCGMRLRAEAGRGQRRVSAAGTGSRAATICDDVTAAQSLPVESPAHVPSTR